MTAMQAGTSTPDMERAIGPDLLTTSFLIPGGPRADQDEDIRTTVGGTDMGSMGGARCMACEFTAKVVVGADPDGVYHQSLSCPTCRDVVLDVLDAPRRVDEAGHLCPECSGQVEVLPDFTGTALCPVCLQHELSVCCLTLLE